MDSSTGHARYRVAPIAAAANAGNGHDAPRSDGGARFADLLAEAEAVRDRVELSRARIAPGLGLRLQAALAGAGAFVHRQLRAGRSAKAHRPAADLR